MRRVKIATPVEGKSVKQLLLDLTEAHLKDLEKKGVAEGENNLILIFVILIGKVYILPP
jgi:hypothetical protein